MFRISRPNKIARAFVLPAVHYFYHKDGRIWSLPCERLPHFFPLRAGNHKQEAALVIDYMGQVNHEDNSRQVNQSSNVEKSSGRTEKNVKSEVAPTDWVNPKIVLDCLKVLAREECKHLVNQAVTGFTSSDGCRACVNKNGQDLTGKLLTDVIER